MCVSNWPIASFVVLNLDWNMNDSPMSHQCQNWSLALTKHKMEKPLACCMYDWQMKTVDEIWENIKAGILHVLLIRHIITEQPSNQPLSLIVPLHVYSQKAHSVQSQPQLQATMVNGTHYVLKLQHPTRVTYCMLLRFSEVQCGWQPQTICYMKKNEREFSAPLWADYSFYVYWWGMPQVHTEHYTALYLAPSQVFHRFPYDKRNYLILKLQKKHPVFPMIS